MMYTNLHGVPLNFDFNCTYVPVKEFSVLITSVRRKRTCKSAPMLS